ncbi:MAG: ketol-acid reductoisomerase, partial [Firmicutes bacterium]|nr:ketol-acid reductoisomerase [Bacillota bacterium]
MISVAKIYYDQDADLGLLKGKTIAIIGYGSQGHSQAQNLRDSGLSVIVAELPGTDNYRAAVEDGFKPVSAAEAAKGADVIQMLTPDQVQAAVYKNEIQPHMTAGKVLMFSHGFNIHFRQIIPPKDVDVIMVAPKGSGTTVRRHFLEGRGINSSFAIYQDATGRARDRCLALGVAIGSGYLFETTFEKEVISDLTGERGVLMGAIYGLWLAQYEVLREHGHSPSEAFNETVEEATQSLYPLIGERGMDWMYANCSTTAQRGALDWFRIFRDATKPVFERLYQSVASGAEARRVLE